MLSEKFKIIVICLIFCFSSNAFATPSMQVTFFNPAPKGNGFWDLVVSFMQASARDLNIELKITYSESHHRSENIKNVIKSLTSINKPDFIIGVLQKQTTISLLSLSTENKVPIYTINTQAPQTNKHLIGIPRENYKMWLGQSIPNDTQVGYFMAKELINHYKKSDPHSTSIDLLALSGNRDSTPSYDRNAGLFQALKEHPEINMRQLVFTDWTQAFAYKKAIGLLNRYPHTKLVWAANDSIALGAAKAINGRNILTTGTDWSVSGLNAIKQGKFLSSYGGHFAEGGFALVMLYDYFHQIDFADDVGLTINTSFSKIDRNNLSDFNSVFGSQNWDKIDFRKFSKKLTPSLERYQFNWEEIFRNVNQQNP